MMVASHTLIHDPRGKMKTEVLRKYLLASSLSSRTFGVGEKKVKTNSSGSRFVNLRDMPFRIPCQSEGMGNRQRAGELRFGCAHAYCHHRCADLGRRKWCDFKLVDKKDGIKSVGFLYYLNPTPNDRNLEFDRKTNLNRSAKDRPKDLAP